MGKLTKSRVLQDGAELYRASRSGDRVRNIFFCHAGRDEDGVKQNHVRWGRKPHPSNSPRSMAILKGYSAL